MCLILFAYEAHPDYRLVLLANRDEFYARPTAPADFWPEVPALLAGRDLEAGGTWMGINHNGRLAAVTNYRDPGETGNGPSRGRLTRDFLSAAAMPQAFLAGLDPPAETYRGFNLLLGDGGNLFYTSNRDQGGLRSLSAGIYGLSNHLLDTPWPKVERGKAALSEALNRQPTPDENELLAILSDRTVAADDQLPDTGVGLAWERVLAPAYIVSPNYGTRSSSLLLIDECGHVMFVERTFADQGRFVGERRFAFEAPAWARPSCVGASAL
ncbi:MAG TPA: NRDE family protein [Desulfuromonadales bacterium]|nr:NRDE family protein [Desulfuromonadales bacterium]